MSAQWLSMGSHLRGVLDVALRVPCIFVIDAILNSYFDGLESLSTVARQVSQRLLGLLLSCVILVLSQRALFRLYAFGCVVLLAATSVLVNYYTTLHIDFYNAYYSAVFGMQLLPRNGPTLWLALIAVQLTIGIGYATLLSIPTVFSALTVVNFLLPILSLALELPADIQNLLVAFSGMYITAQTVFYVTLNLKWFYYTIRYVYLLLRHMYRIYGLQVIVEDTWKRIRFPDVLRVFWLTRLVAQAIILVYVVKVTQGDSENKSYFISWSDSWEVLCNLIISGCDSTLTVLGMSAVISSLAHYLGLGILAFIGSTEEEDKRLGFVAPVLFFILALQTGLSGLEPEERLVRLSRNMCLLLTAILHFIHGMTDPVLMSLSASHVSSFRRHLPVLMVSISLFILPIVLSCTLWQVHTLNTWLFAVTAFCVELCLKVIVSLTVYTLFIIDGYYNVLWEKLDDYIYYVRSTGNVIEFIFGVIMFGNGAYTMMFESGSKIRACMMCLHAYFNIYLQAKNGWKTFINRRTAVKKINSLPEVRGNRLHDIGDVCAICYQEFTTSARITPCNHYFHALCLRKWLYIQDTCPMCHQGVYIEENQNESTVFVNNNGNIPQQPVVENLVVAAAAAVDADSDLNEDNDSIEYDEEEWTTQNGNAPVEDEYLDDDTDASEV
ncbi:E3 ubiquitin-protein ligase RNF139 [Chiloscyllium plagiosum]|uniref:E3 ubiquitin-protein ligase RNF139 n=1 Tax=Chiloscyllium plagiosum TaxID=36176 RepID=UPI001CB7F9FD|nr:E3 ubiquitin-protein ligase RNF139 [Chiloscyllium plagiosum]